MELERLATDWLRICYDWSMRKCCKCGEEKDQSEFHKRKSAKDGLQYHCKSCQRKYVKAHYANNTDYYLAKAKRNRKPAFQRHGLTVDQYQAMIDFNGAMCSICQVAMATVIDHDHECCPKDKSCGKCVRGILCKQCNWMLGNANDKVETLERAVQYLKGNAPVYPVATNDLKG